MSIAFVTSFQRGPFRRGATALAALAVAGCAFGGWSATAWAQTPPCKLTGTVPGKADAPIYDKREAGMAIAQLTGADLPVTLTLDGPVAKGRIKVSTSMGTGALRIDGWAPASSFRFFAARDLQVIGRHVWISKSRPLELISGKDGSIKVAYTILGSDNQKLSATVPCDALTLAIPTTEPGEIPATARTYQTKSNQLELFDEPGGTVVFTFNMLEDARLPVWSDSSKRGFAHIMSRSDVTIDAWVRQRDLSWIRRGEYFSQDVPRPAAHNPQQLALQDPPPVITVTGELTIYAKANSEVAIGAAEVGAKIYKLAVSHDWANVLPVGLGVMPSDGHGFWVKKSELTEAKP